MGVPAFFKWLSLKYPKILRTAVCYNGSNVNTGSVNGVFDCLYIDLNGIIHPCCHRNNLPICNSEIEMFDLICAYIEKVVNVVQPRKLIYFAIDGVAPRAKMNQQRSRRYKSSFSLSIENEIFEKLTQDFEIENKFHPPKPSYFDSNVISPGTQFLHKCSEAILNFIQNKISTDSMWQKTSVIFSDANVPGEGEHKIMDYIRSQRSYPDYDPYLRHCLYGNDADLIMLGLATHEAFFYILREATLTKFEQEAQTKEAADLDVLKAHQFVDLNILRNYLKKEFKSDNNELDFERCLDDFILMCFFVGNDFLPHLPSLTIYLGSIDQLIYLYQNVRSSLPDYLTFNGNINIYCLKQFISYIGEIEDDIIKNSLKRERDFQKKKSQLRIQNSSKMPLGIHIHKYYSLLESNKIIYPNSQTGFNKEEQENHYIEFKNRLADLRSIYEKKFTLTEQVVLGEGNWRSEYYITKFGLVKDDLQNLDKFVEKVAQYYVDGLCWVLKYYFQGNPSWEWYYPFHYAPFARDLVTYNIKSKSNFTHGAPLKPFEQLMCVLPPQSSHFLPQEYQNFMNSNTSPIQDFYPNSFVMDPNGKRLVWQYVPLLPFINIDRLKDITMNLTDENPRNTCSHDKLIIAKNHPIALNISKILFTDTNKIWLPDFQNLNYTIFGFIHSVEVPYSSRSLRNFGNMSTSLYDKSSKCQYHICAGNETVEPNPSFYCINLSCFPKTPHESKYLIDQEYSIECQPELILKNDDRLFNSGAAKRMIMNLLGLKIYQINKNMPSNTKCFKYQKVIYKRSSTYEVEEISNEHRSKN